MSRFILGTDTDAGKTAVASALMARLTDSSTRYWKPVQSGFPPDDDTASVIHQASLDFNRACPPLYSFQAPLSPHRAAALDGKEISLELLLEEYWIRSRETPLLVEGAGGLYVPLNENVTWLDFLRETGMGILLVARTGLGTINHSLLTLEALYRNDLRVDGIFFFGPAGADEHDSMATICRMGEANFLGRVDRDEDGKTLLLEEGEALEGFLSRGFL